jgi:hypothetical protein
MFTEGEVPPEVAAEYKKMEGEKNMEKPKLEVVGSKDEERELDVGDLIRDLGDMQDEVAVEAASKTFVQRVLAREGGDQTKAEAATRALKFSWVNLFKEGRMKPEVFQEGIYSAVVKMLKPTEQPPAKEKEKEAMREERRKDAWKNRAA